MTMKVTPSKQNATSTRRQASADSATQHQDCDQLQPVDDIVDYVTTYARQNPGTAALWCFGVGFIVGWKLKPW